MASRIGAAIGIGFRIGRDVIVVLLLLAILSTLDSIYKLTRLQTEIMLGAATLQGPLPVPEESSQVARR